jgi:hypothetical protein
MVQLELVLAIPVEVRIGEVAGKHRIVVTKCRSQQQRALAAQRQIELRQVPGVPIEDAFGPTLGRDRVPVVVEDSEDISLLQGLGSPLLKRDQRGDDAGDDRSAVRDGRGWEVLH